MISRLSTAGKTPPIKRAARGMPYGRLFIISRTNSVGFTSNFAILVQQIMISHYATGEVDAVYFSQHSGIPYALTLL